MAKEFGEGGKGVTIDGQEFPRRAQPKFQLVQTDLQDPPDLGQPDIRFIPDLAKPDLRLTPGFLGPFPGLAAGAHKFFPELSCLGTTFRPFILPIHSPPPWRNILDIISHFIPNSKRKKFILIRPFYCTNYPIYCGYNKTTGGIHHEEEHCQPS